MTVSSKTCIQISLEIHQLTHTDKAFIEASTTKMKTCDKEALLITHGRCRRRRRRGLDDGSRA